MTVTVIDRRNLINDADALTDWSFSVNNNARAIFTADPDPIEATGHIGIAVSTSTEEGYFGGTIPNSGNLSDTLLYIWGLSQGIMDTETNGGVQIVLGDGTNRRGYHVGGSDVSSFRHPTDNPNYECHILDTANLPTATTNFQGAGAPTLTTITEVGLAFKTLQDAKGGTENCFIDIMRFGADGIEFTSTLPGDIIRFDSVAAYDRSGLTGRAMGAIREIGDGVFSAQAKITFGTIGDVVSRDCDFLTKNETFLWEAREMSTATRYGFEVRKSEGGSTGRASFIAGNRVSQGVGDNGTTFIANSAANAKANFIASQNALDSVGIYGCVFRDWEEFIFRGDDSAAVDTEIFQTDFIQCGNIDLGRIEARNCGFFSTKATGTDSAAVTFNDTTNMSGLFFSSGGTGHAISIDSATTGQTFVFTGFEYTGYASTTGNTGNEVLINNSGQPITVQVSGGDGPTVDSDGVRGVVTVQNNVTVTVSGILGNSEIKVLPTSGSPYSGNSLNDTLNIATETVSANTFVGDGTNYLAIGFGHANDTNQDGSQTYNSAGSYSLVGTTTLNPEGTFVFSNFPGVLQDTNSTSPRDLVAGDLIRITPRDDNVNPTLQNFVTAEVVGTPATSGIQILSGIDDGLDFGIELSGITESVGIPLGNIKPSYEFTGTVTVTGGSGTWSTSTTNCTVTPSSGNSGDTFTITFSATGAFSAQFLDGSRSVTLSGTVVEESRNVVTWKSFVDLGIGDLLYLNADGPSGAANSKTVTVEKVDARYQFSVADNTQLDFLTYRIGSDSILTTGQTITTDNSSFPISQVGDRNYRNPA